MQCLHRISDDWINDGHKIIDLLGRFSRTLSSTNDWQCPLILEFGDCNESGFLPLSSHGHSFGLRQYTLAIGNLVTAYRILDQLLPDHTGYALYIEPPQDVKERFDILLVKGNAGREFHSPAIEHHIDIANCIIDNLSERGVQVRGQRWFILLQDINTGLERTGKDALGFCIEEIKKRGLEVIHPWVIAALDN